VGNGDITINLFDIERYAVNDGPGIRTVLFFKGCPLSCVWCSNPESQSEKPELFYRAGSCIGCENCVQACGDGLLSFPGTAPGSDPTGPAGGTHEDGGEERAQSAGGLLIDDERCSGCGRCAEACYTGALSLAGKEWDLADVMEIVARDESFYRNSGGGVTFSGGEPTMQSKALYHAARSVKVHGYHTCIETCGYFRWERLEPALPYLDLFLFDIKHLEPVVHEQVTGVSNRLILENLKRIAEEGRDFIIRFPLIPGINDSRDHVENMAGYLSKQAPGSRIDVLPYHRLGNSKYSCLRRDYPLNGTPLLTDEKVEEVKKVLEGHGLRARVEK
jgi:pyruvate formate lyase activating enzyme